MNKEIIKHFIEWLDDNSIDYAIIGAVALNAYGYFRNTADIDFLTSNSDASIIKEYLQGLGFEITHENSLCTMYVHPLGEKLDLVYLDDEKTIQSLFASSNTATIFDDLSIKVLSPVHFAMLKAFAAKQEPERELQDLEDVRQLYKRGIIPKEEFVHILEKFGHQDMLHHMLEKMGESEEQRGI